MNREACKERISIEMIRERGILSSRIVARRHESESDHYERGRTFKVSFDNENDPGLVIA